MRNQEEDMPDLEDDEYEEELQFNIESVKRFSGVTQKIGFKPTAVRGDHRIDFQGESLVSNAIKFSQTP